MPFRQLVVRSARDFRGSGEGGGGHECCVKEVEIEMHGDGSGGWWSDPLVKTIAMKVWLLARVESVAARCS